MSWEKVEDETIIEELEKKRQRKSSIREFLEEAEEGKWYQVEWNRGAVTRIAKITGIKVQTTEHNGKTYVKVLSKP